MSKSKNVLAFGARHQASSPLKQNPAGHFTTRGRSTMKKTVRDFSHPESIPTADHMLQDLAAYSGDEQDFGRGVRFSSAYRFALRAETMIYTAWVTLQCKKLGLREPGELTEAQFAERYWVDDAAGRD